MNFIKIVFSFELGKEVQSVIFNSYLIKFSSLIIEIKARRAGKKHNLFQDLI